VASSVFNVVTHNAPLTSPEDLSPKRIEARHGGRVLGLSLPLNKRRTAVKRKRSEKPHGGDVYAAFLRAGYRLAGPERLPLGRPGDRPRGLGALANVPKEGRSEAKLRKTLVGVSEPDSSGLSHGKRRSATMARPRRSCT